MTIRATYGRRPVVLTDTEFGLAGRGSPQMHPRSEVGSVVSAIFWPGMRQHVFVLDRDGGLLLRLRGDVYPPEEMNQFVIALDVPVTDFPGIVTKPHSGNGPGGTSPLTDRPDFVKPTEFDEEYPGLLSERDFKPVGDSPVLATVFTIGAVLLVILMALVVFGLIFLGPH